MSLHIEVLPIVCHSDYVRLHCAGGKPDRYSVYSETPRDTHAMCTISAQIFVDPRRIGGRNFN